MTSLILVLFILELYSLSTAAEFRTMRLAFLILDLAFQLLLDLGPCSFILLLQLYMLYSKRESSGNMALHIAIPSHNTPEST